MKYLFDIKSNPLNNFKIICVSSIQVRNSQIGEFYQIFKWFTPDIRNWIALRTTIVTSGHDAKHWPNLHQANNSQQYQIQFYIDDPTKFLHCVSSHRQHDWYIRALFIWPAKDGDATFVGCRKFSPPCSFYCTEDARSNYENLQKIIKTRLFWAYFVPFVLNKSSYT